MGKKYTVHSRHDTTVKVPAKTPEGHDIEGDMPCSIIELVPVDPRDTHTITLRELTPTAEDRKRIAEVFAIDSVVVHSWTKEA